MHRTYTFLQALSFWLMYFSIFTGVEASANPGSSPNPERFLEPKMDPAERSTSALSDIRGNFSNPSSHLLNSTEAWNRALQYRRAEEFFAPSRLRYVQYQLDESGIEKSRETGIWSLSYDDKGKVKIDVKSASKDGKDYTEERRRRLNRGRANTTRMMDILSPFDQLAQGVIRREQGTLKELEGEAVWEYSFALPKDDRTLVGTAWVEAREGKPVGFRYSVQPLPMFVDRIDVRVTFHGDKTPGRFQEIEYSFAASFLIFSWIGGGIAWPEEWVALPVRPRFVD